MDFAVPQALVLLLPLAWAARSPQWPTGALRWVRLATLACAVVALAQPHFIRASSGTDVVVVVDRSASMPPGHDAAALELVRLLEAQRRTGDRLGVVTFGRAARVETTLRADGQLGGFQSPVDPEASNLDGALQAAEALLTERRAARVLVVSDGQSTGLDPRGAARRLAALGVNVDVRHAARPQTGIDVAVVGIDVPARLAEGAPLLLPVAVRANGPASVRVTLLRDGQPLAATDADVTAGETVLTFRDRLETPGLHTYAARVTVAGDVVPENDVARAVLRVDGPARVVVVTTHPTGALVQALRAAHVTVEARTPGPFDLSQLEGASALVLENVPASTLGEATLHVISHYVREAGGGLVMTGGPQSLGSGGYRRSPVEEVLPVSLELRQEQRKAAIALSVVMDCSCSMGARVPDGRTKMELAAEGVISALQLLNPNDEASVQLVDTDVHELFSLRPVSDGLPLDQVARAFSGGGGIYVGVGLRAAKEQILSSNKATRHVLLFSDASDSEEPADYVDTLERLRREKVTVSVIGMGTPGDSDADLLRDVASRGSGRMYFADDPTSLPRIFSEETIAVARASFVEGPTPVALAPDLAALWLPGASGLTVGGYNRVWLKPAASIALRTGDDDAAPVVAFWPSGHGRAAVLTAEVDGPASGGFRTWSGSRGLLESLVRWVQNSGGPPGDAVVRAQLEGDAVHVTVDVAAGAPLPAGATVKLLASDGSGVPLQVPLRPEDEGRLGASLMLPGSGTWHPVVAVDGRVVRAAPVTLPWAPEFEPMAEGVGRAALLRVAEAGRGVERLSVSGLFEAAGRSQSSAPMAWWWVAGCVLLLVVDVWLRRFSAVRPARPSLAQPAEVVTAHPAPAAAPPPSEVDPLAAARARARGRTDRV